MQHALEFIRENKDRPFFCYVPFHIVHAPLQAKDSDLKGVDPKVTDETKRTYAAMVQAMDKNVAAILGELDKLGLRDNTIVVFTSDNGATKDGSNLPVQRRQAHHLRRRHAPAHGDSLAEGQGRRPHLGWTLRRARYVPDVDGDGRT